MATTQRPFLDAYRRATTPTTTAPSLGAAADPLAAFSSSELVMGGTDRHAPTSADTLTSSERPPTGIHPDPRHQPHPRAKRPLSSFLHNFDETPRTKQEREPRAEAQWPAHCLDLLAAAAPAYDKLLERTKGASGLGSVTGILGCGTRVGVSTTAICLGLRCATHATSVLVVDADLRAAGIAEHLKLSVPVPWIRALREGQPLAQAVVSAGDVAIDLLLQGAGESQDLDAWARFHVGNAAGQMRRKYQHTLVDLGSDLSLANQVMAALAVDHLILVTNPETTSAQRQQVEQFVAEEGYSVAGVVQGV